MKYNETVAAALAAQMLISPRVRNKVSIAKLHRTGNGADLAFVDVTIGIPGAELCTLSFTAKILPNAGRFLALTEHPQLERIGEDASGTTLYKVAVDKEGKPVYRPDSLLSNELRAAITAKVFAMPQIDALATQMEQLIAASSVAPAATAPIAGTVAVPAIGTPAPSQSAPATMSLEQMRAIVAAHDAAAVDAALEPSSDGNPFARGEQVA